MNTPLGGGTPANVSGGTNFVDTSSRAPSSYNASPNSSPRVPSINCSINSTMHSTQQGTLLNGTKRSSCSDDSVSSESSSTALPHVVGGLGAGLNRSATNGIYPNVDGAKPMLTRQLAGNAHNNLTPIQHIDSSNSTEFYEECGNDISAATLNISSQIAGGLKSGKKKIQCLQS